MFFPDQNSTNLPISILNNLNEVSKEYSPKEYLKYHQFIVYNYLIKNAKTRGLLLFHDMGMVFAHKVTTVACETHAVSSKCTYHTIQHSQKRNDVTVAQNKDTIDWKQIKTQI